MEDGLVLTIQYFPKRKADEVLILVVMEDGLVLTPLNFPQFPHQLS